jgi:hypothetical protein
MVLLRNFPFMTSSGRSIAGAESFFIGIFLIRARPVNDGTDLSSDGFLYSDPNEFLY